MKFIYLGILSMIIVSCVATQGNTKKEKCPKIYTNHFTEVLNAKYQTVSNKDTVSLNEIRFECVISAFLTHKIMFDKFGKWDRVIYPKKRKLAILVWERVDLFSNGEKYDVFTNGIEEWKHIYASVMIFDEKGKDLLSIDSTEKEKLTNYFGDMIKLQDPEKKDFYEKYWRTIDPKRWEKGKR